MVRSVEVRMAVPRDAAADDMLEPPSFLRDL
jgi:hypothetical protein